MLVLKRRTQERVIITLPDGRRITVKLCEVDRNYARLGFDAPTDIRIDREEIAAAKERTSP